MDSEQLVKLSTQSPPPDAGLSITHIYEQAFESLRHFVGCKVCVKPMYEPYTISCGHTFCYSCLAQWFSNHREHKTCPECRANVVQRPAPSYIIREMTQMFISRAELMPDGETIDEHRVAQEEEASIVEKDKSNKSPRIGGLFRGCFKDKPSVRGTLINDIADGVLRCPVCAWELEDGWCNACQVDYESENEMRSITHLSDSDDQQSVFAGIIGGRHYPTTGAASRRASRRSPHLLRAPSTISPDDTDYSQETETDLDGFIEDDPFEDATEEDPLNMITRQYTGSATPTILSESEGDSDTPGNNYEELDTTQTASYNALRRGPPEIGVGARAGSDHDDEEGSEIESDSGSESLLVSALHGSRKRRRVVSDDSEDDGDEDDSSDGEDVRATGRSRSRRRRIESSEDSDGDDDDSAAEVLHRPGCPNHPDNRPGNHVRTIPYH